MFHGSPTQIESKLCPLSDNTHVCSTQNVLLQLKSGFQPGKALIAAAYGFGQLGAFRAKW
jgi:hypothetical protein